jgi:hypothetical protein
MWRSKMARFTVSAAAWCAFTLMVLATGSMNLAQDVAPSISPSRPIPGGLAPKMQVKLIKSAKDEKVYAVILHAGDEALSGLTDFAAQYHIADAHFTATARSAELHWAGLTWSTSSTTPFRSWSNARSSP